MRRGDRGQAGHQREDLQIVVPEPRRPAEAAQLDHREREIDAEESFAFSTMVPFKVTFAVKYALLVISEATTKLGDTAATFAPTFPGAKSAASATGCGTTMTPLTWPASGW